MAVVLLVPWLGVGAHRGQHPYGHLAESAGGEAEQFGAGRIQPLEVVGDDQDRALGGQRAQHGEDREAQGEAVALQGRFSAAGEGRFEGGALRGGQPVGDLVHHQAEEVGQGEEGQMGFGLGRRAAQDGACRFGAFRGQRTQNGGLSYSRGAVHEHAASVGELLARAREELLPSDDQVGAGSRRLLEVPSHGHRSPRMSCPSQY
jgi:hypothetical protein